MQHTTIATTTPEQLAITLRVCDAIKATVRARVACRFGHADDRLSRALSAVLKAGAVHDVDDQLAGYGDCTGLLHAGTWRAQQAVAQRYGYAGLDALKAEAAARLRTANYHMHMLLSAIPDDDAVEVL